MIKLIVAMIVAEIVCCGMFLMNMGWLNMRPLECVYASVGIVAVFSILKLVSYVIDETR